MQITYKPKTKKNEFTFHKWFAWRPVRTSDNQFTWLENVYRRKEYVSRSDRYKNSFITKAEYITTAMKSPDKISKIIVDYGREDDQAQCSPSYQAGSSI
jgi:hypothetical protein